MKWIDNHSVVLASNFVAIGTEDILQQLDKQNKLHVDVKRPEVICRYSKSMGGIDKKDMLIAYYRNFICSKKWTLRMFMHAIELSLANSWLEYRQEARILKVPEKEIIDLMHIRLRVAEAMIRANKKKTCQKGMTTNNFS